MQRHIVASRGFYRQRRMYGFLQFINRFLIIDILVTIRLIRRNTPRTIVRIKTELRHFLRNYKRRHFWLSRNFITKRHAVIICPKAQCQKPRRLNYLFKVDYRLYVIIANKMLFAPIRLPSFIFLASKATDDTEAMIE